MASKGSEKQQSNNMDSSPSQNGTSNGASESSTASSTSVTNHLTQALRDLARGESAAAALEANLANLESKLDDILATLGSVGGDDGDEVATEKDDGRVNGATPDDKEKKAES